MQAEMKIDVSIENIGELGRRMNITVPATEVDRRAEERLTVLSRTVKISGFRPGHVPMDVIRQRYGDKVMKEITQGLLQESISSAMLQHNLRPAGMPSVETVGEVAMGKDFTFVAKVELFPEIKVSNCTGLKLTRETSKPNDKLVDSVLNNLAQSQRTFAKKDGVAKQGDRVTVNATGVIAGSNKPFPGGDLDNQQVEIGSNSLIPGFEEELIGLGAEDEKNFEIAYPADYHNGDLAGTKVKFAVKVIAVETINVPKITDEMAQKFGSENIADMKVKVAEQLKTDIATASFQRMKRELFDALDKSNQFTVPDNLVEAEFNSIWTTHTQDLAGRGLKIEDLGKSEDETRAEYRELAARRVRLGLLLAEIGKANDIKVSDEQIKAEIERMALSYGAQAEQVRKHYSDPNNYNQVAGPLYEKLVTDWLVEKAEITDKEVDAEELLSELQ